MGGLPTNCYLMGNLMINYGIDYPILSDFHQFSDKTILGIFGDQMRSVAERFFDIGVLICVASTTWIFSPPQIQMIAGVWPRN